MRTRGKVFEIVDRDPNIGASHVGHRLRELRLIAGVTQAELGARMNVCQSAVTHLERRRDVHVSTLKQFLAALGATLRIDARFTNASQMINSLREAQVEFSQIDEDQLLLPIVGDEHLPPSKDVVFSIKPEYSREIVSGKKTIELRRRFPTTIPAGTRAFIYETSPTRAIAGVAAIGAVHKATPNDIWNSFSNQACIAKVDFDDYFAGTENAFAIELRNARPLRRPIELSELRDRFSFEPPQSFLYVSAIMREAFRNECVQVSD